MGLNINKILRDNPRGCSRGAPLGAPSFHDTEGCEPLHLQRVQLVDGDYGPDATYWGCSPKMGHVYCAFNGGTNPAQSSRIYVRAHTRREAAAAVANEFPGVSFIRSI